MCSPLDFCPAKELPCTDLKLNLACVDGRTYFPINNATCGLNDDINPKDFYDFLGFERIERMRTNSTYNQTVQKLLGKQADFANAILESGAPLKGAIEEARKDEKLNLRELEPDIRAALKQRPWETKPSSPVEIETGTDYMSYLKPLVEIPRYFVWGQFCNMQNNRKDCFKFFAANPETIKAVVSTAFDPKTIADKIGTVFNNALGDLSKISIPTKMHFYFLDPGRMYLPKFIHESFDGFQRYLTYVN